MNVFDAAIALLAVGSLVFGFFKGFARIAIGLGSLVVAFLVAAHFEGSVAAWFVSLRVSETPARFAAYLVIFVATMVAGGAVAWLVGKVLKLTKLSWADRLAGGALAFLAALLAAALVLHPIAAAAPGGARLLRTSRLGPYVAVVADLADLGAPPELSDRYRRGVEALRRIWRGEIQPEIERALAPSRG